MQPPAFRRILVPLDGSCFGESVLPHVSTLARVADGEVHLVSVLERDPAAVATGSNAELRLEAIEAEQYLESLAGPLRDAGLTVETDVRVGSAVPEILESAREIDCDLVALAARPRRPQEHLISRGVASSVLAAGEASVLVARGDGPARLPSAWRDARHRSVLVPVDGSPASHSALAFASLLAEHEGAELTLVHVRPGGGGQGGASTSPAAGGGAEGSAAGGRDRYLETICDAVDSEGVTVRGKLSFSSDVPVAVQRTVDRAEPDLLVLAAHGAGDSQHPYGHCARWLLQHSEVPILVVQDRPAAADRGEAVSLRADRRGRQGRSRGTPFGRP